MIPGVEGRHSWTPPGASGPAVTLNRITDDAGAPVWPRYRVTAIQGLRSTGDPEDNRDRPPGRGLEIARRSNRRGKTIVYEGLVEARTLIQLEEACAALTAAFDEISGEGRMDVSWHPLYAAADGIPAKYYEARSLTCEIPERQESDGWKRSFVIGLRMGDRRYFDETSGVHTAETTEALAEVPFA